MQRMMLKGKIHRATVTDADLDYEGSVAIDAGLMEAAGILPYEKVAIYNVTNGNRLETYAIVASKGSGEVCINGAAAHKAGKGDIVIIACYAGMTEAEAEGHLPSLVYVDENNRVKELKSSIAQPA
ncbi:Aspartate 1-decarboxylase [hydrothermal vent metagenome]|uniref:Aspartate 1-decarboxylase n=1 Tax=hydrothermal vent metagenome TaxID=652676 RepID=A0A3B0V5B1_9ZZZZ